MGGVNSNSEPYGMFLNLNFRIHFVIVSYMFKKLEIKVYHKQFVKMIVELNCKVSVLLVLKVYQEFLV
jgi:hypothetical protein